MIFSILRRVAGGIVLFAVLILFVAPGATQSSNGSVMVGDGVLFIMLVAATIWLIGSLLYGVILVFGGLALRGYSIALLVLETFLFAFGWFVWSNHGLWNVREAGPSQLLVFVVPIVAVLDLLLPSWKRSGK